MCDDILRGQLVFHWAATDAQRMNTLIGLIQVHHARRKECRKELWDPQVKTQPEAPGPGMCFPDPQAARGVQAGIGGTPVPPGLHQKGNASMTVRDTSGRDSTKSIVVHWSDDPASRPADGAKCWVYNNPARTWGSQ